MLTLLIRGGGLVAHTFFVAACSSQTQADQSQEVINVGDQLEGDRSQLEAIESNDAFEPPVADAAGVSEGYSEDFVGAAEETSPQKIWVGMSGIPQGCTLTNYDDLSDVKVVMQNDGAVVLQKTPNLIIAQKSAPRGKFKMVYTTDEELCEVVVTRASFTDPEGSIDGTDESETGN